MGSASLRRPLERMELCRSRRRRMTSASNMCETADCLFSSLYCSQGLYSVFDSRASYEAEYRDDADHREFVKTVIAPNVDEIMAYDIGCEFEKTVRSSSLGPTASEKNLQFCVHGYTHCYSLNFPALSAVRMFSASNRLASIMITRSPSFSLLPRKLPLSAPWSFSSFRSEQ